MAYLTTGEAEVKKVKWGFKMHNFSLPHQPNNRKNSSQKKTIKEVEENFETKIIILRDSVRSTMIGKSGQYKKKKETLKT